MEEEVANDTDASVEVDTKTKMTDPLQHDKAKSPTPALSSTSSKGLAGNEMLIRETVASVHRASMHKNTSIRRSAVQSLEEIVVEFPLLVLQSWLDQFARTNGGSSPAEYAGHSRVRLLHSLQLLVDIVVSKALFEDDNVAHRACIGRIIAMATEEMTRQTDVIPDVQKPCSAVLVHLGVKYVDRVMDSVTQKFQPGTQSHFYIIQTLSSMAQTNATGMVPFLKAVLGTMVANMKSVKRDNMRFAFANAFSHFSNAILDYLAHVDGTPDPSVTRGHFCKEIDLIHDFLFTSWLSNKDLKVKHAVLEALASMSALQSDDRRDKWAAQMLQTFISTYRRTPEAFFVTQSIYQLMEAMADRDPAILEPTIEPLLTALFQQVTQTSAVTDNTKPNVKKNNDEVMRCYNVLVRTHKDKLITGLTVRMGSVDENVRLASLTIIKHMMTTSMDQIEDRMPDIFKTIHSKLGEQSNKVRKMLALLTAQLGRLGFLEGSEGRDFLEFIVRLCALNPDETATSALINGAGKLAQLVPAEGGDSEVTNKSLKEMCDKILELLSIQVENMEPILWPHLLEYLLAPDFSRAVPSVVKSLAQLAERKHESNSPDYIIDYADFQYIPGPYVLFARLIVLAAVPFPESRGTQVLAFLQHFAPNINKHIPALWKQRLPLLQTYLEKHISGQSPTWDQDQWQDWLLLLVDDTVSEIDLDEWTTALAGALCQQLSLYSTPESVQEKCFLVLSLGRVMKKSSSKQLILDNLSSVFQATNHAEEKQQLACAKSFGTCASKHLGLVLDKLETLLKSGAMKKSSSFFGLLRDNKLEEEQQQLHTTILFCVGQVAANASKADLSQKVDEIMMKFFMPALKGNNAVLKVCSLRALTDLARAIQPEQLKEAKLEIKMAHHNDAINETIKCLKDSTWPIGNKQVALVTTLELIRSPPFLSQGMRCSLLKACFTAVFPSLVEQCLAKMDNYSVVSRGENELKQIIKKLLVLVKELLKQEMEQSTLDEIFTLLEQWLKKEHAVAREMAISILKNSLQTFLDFVRLDRTSPSSFAPGPYIIGSIVPRCFDSSRQVQKVALQCLQLLIHILSTFEGHAGDYIDDMTSKLKALSGMNPGNHDDEPMNSTVVSKAVSDVLDKCIVHHQLLPLIHSLIEGLCDDIPCSARGTSTILCALLEARGSELYAQAPDLVDKLHAKLLVLDSGETRVRALTSLRVLTSFNPNEVVTSLLAHPLPMDEALTSVWKMLTQDQSLARGVLKHLLELINTGPVYQTEVVGGGGASGGGGDSKGKSIFGSKKQSQTVSTTITITTRVASHVPLSAILALGCMFDMREMDMICDGDFASIFVPVVSSMACYMGVAKCEEVKPKVQQLTSEEEKKRHCVGGPSVDPFGDAKAALISFLNCKGCSSVATAVNNVDDLASLSAKADAPAFATFMFVLAEHIVQDFPQYLSKLVSGFQPLLNSRLGGHRLSATAFFAQMVQTDQSVDSSLAIAALENLHSALNAELKFDGNVSTSVDGELDVSSASSVGDRSFNSEAASEDSKEPKKMEEEPYIRLLSLRALSFYRGQHARHDFGSTILTAFMRTIGEDFKSDLNHVALVGLGRVLESGSLTENNVHCVLSDLVMKIHPFFDSGQPRDSAAAMRSFARLSPFAVGSYREVYIDHLHGVLVALLLHANDDSAETSAACREGLAQILTNLFPDDAGLHTTVMTHLSKGAAGAGAAQVHRENEEVSACDGAAASVAANSDHVAFDYLVFLRDFSSLTETTVLTEMFPAYTTTALTYFRSSSAPLRSNAAHLATFLILASDQTMLADLDEAAVLQGLSSLLTDQVNVVQHAAAAGIGKVVIHLKRGGEKKDKENVVVPEEEIKEEEGETGKDGILNGW